MSLIQSISSTLKTWVFKKKLLKFSDRYRMEPQACFYCPEMCRFSCPTAETLKDDTVTPRGKMSLLHLAEKGYSIEKISGTAENRLWHLEQCTGCGRCTEYCVYEVDVASNLRNERATHFNREAVAGRGSPVDPAPFGALLEELRALKGTVLLCEPGRKAWWEARKPLLEEMGITQVAEPRLPTVEWGWGKLADIQVEAIGESLAGCKQLWIESPETGWFLAQGVKEEREALGADIRLVWQRFFPRFAAKELAPDVVFHESFHLSRLFPRLGYSVPMYERGLMPFHSGWNVWDCGGEGYYKHAHPASAKMMGARYLHDVKKDGREVRRIICQSPACIEHLRGMTDAEVVYWLDALEEPQPEEKA